MSQAVVTINSAPRALPGSGQVATTFVPSQVACTWSWGLQPATALIDWVSAQAQPSLVAGAGIQIDVGGHSFYGLTDNCVLRLASDGYTLMQEFKDNREYLMWDVVTAAFNIHENKIVNGQYIQRYKHLLPADYASGTWTYTDFAYQANEILDFLFESLGEFSPWLRFYDELMYEPVYDLDYTAGIKLGEALVDISDRLGCVFTLMGGPYTLVWTLKGFGTLPGFPANSDNRRVGNALSGNPSRVQVIGDRNRYECLNVAMEADWLPAWQDEFWDFNDFIKDIYLNERLDVPVGIFSAGTAYTALPGDDDHVIGYALANARARLITVAQYAALRDARSSGGGDGDAFRDYRRFQGRSRLNLPAMLYINEIIFRAFRLPDAFRLRQSNGTYADKYSFNLDPQALVEVTHDPVTGWMTALQSDGVYQAPSSEHNGYAIVQGFQVSQDAFKTLRPDYFNLSDWISSQLLWRESSFQIDDSGEGDQFIIFDEPVISSGDLIHQVTIDEVPQTYPDSRPRVAQNAGATVSVPPVRAALTFLGEKFSYTLGTPGRDDVVNIAGLAGEFLTGFSISGGGSSAPLNELPFADGFTASQKAFTYGTGLLNGQFYYSNGGYTVQGSNATQISAVLDRVTIRWDAQDGLTEEVDFTNERARNVSLGFGGVAVLQLEPERQFDRRSQLDALFVGQDELRQQANQLKLAAGILKATPKMLTTLVNTVHRMLGTDADPTTILIDGGVDGGFGLLSAGTPLFKEVDGNNAVMPDNAGADAGANNLDNPVFTGVTVMDNEDPSGGVRVTKTGDGGVVQVRVKGPVALNNSVGQADDKGARDYLVGTPGLPVGTALEPISDTSIQIIRVQAGASPPAGFFQGEFDPDASYSAQMYCFITGGANTGAYIYVSPTPSTGSGGSNPTLAPYLGGGQWVQYPLGTLGVWM